MQRITRDNGFLNKEKCMNFLKIRGHQIAFKDLNPEKEEAILLVHGHPFDHTMWEYQYEVLQDYRLLLPDLKGYGQSDTNLEKIFIESQALDLALLLDELGIEKVHLIGLSMGGQIIVEFQRLFPASVNSLIIAASTPTGETEESYTNRLALANTIQEIGMLTYTQKDIHKYINLEVIRGDSEVYQHLFRMMTKTTVAGAVAAHRGRAERRDNFNYLKNIQIPTLVIAGEKDYFFSVEVVEQVANEIPNAQFEMIKGSGHLPNMEKPAIFNELITNFYKTAM